MDRKYKKNDFGEFVRDYSDTVKFWEVVLLAANLVVFLLVVVEVAQLLK